MDHFLGIFQTRLPELVNHRSYRVLSSEARKSDNDMEHISIIVVEVEGAVPGQRACFEFHLRRKAMGPRKGALMTHAVLRREGGDTS